ncbi:hypothetical protein AB3S75_020190 [Citrus x aurantiifolia]
MALILALLFGSPLRKLLILGLDKLKQGRGPLVAKSVGATVLVVLSSAVYNVVEIHKAVRSIRQKRFSWQIFFLKHPSWDSPCFLQS